MMKMSIISITNQKGGVGKTTTAVNLAACLAAVGKNTLVVDMDSQANTSQNLLPKETNRTTYDMLLNELPVSNYAVPSKYENLDIVPASLSLAKAENKISSNQIQGILKGNKYDYVIIDCPPALGQLTVNSIFASDYIIVPLEASVFALEGTKTLFDTIRVVQLKTDVKLLGTLLTRHDVRTRIAKDLAVALSSNKTLNLFNIIINESVKIKEAQYAGKSIIDYDHYSMPALQYSMFAKEVMDRVEKIQR